jgi:hypothetical protein
MGMAEDGLVIGVLKRLRMTSLGLDRISHCLFTWNCLRGGFLHIPTLLRMQHEQTPLIRLS